MNFQANATILLLPGFAVHMLLQHVKSRQEEMFTLFVIQWNQELTGIKLSNFPSNLGPCFLTATVSKNQCEYQSIEPLSFPQVNSQSLLGATHDEAVKVLRSVTDTMVILICDGFDPSLLEANSPSLKRRQDSLSSIDKEDEDLIILRKVGNEDLRARTYLGVLYGMVVFQTWNKFCVNRSKITVDSGFFC